VASSWSFYSSVITMMHGPINISGITVAQKNDGKQWSWKGGGGRSDNITLVFGCNSVISCRFLNTRIVKIFPKGSDPQLVPITRCRSPPLFSSSGPAASSATHFHCSEVLQSLYKAGKFSFFFHWPTTGTLGLIADHMLHFIFKKY